MISGLDREAWNAVGDTAKWAWDRMLDIGREDTLDEKIATLQEKIARARQKNAMDSVFLPRLNMISSN